MRQAVNDLRAPALLFLLLKDCPANFPIEGYQVEIQRLRGTFLRLVNLFLMSPSQSV